MRLFRSTRSCLSGLSLFIFSHSAVSSWTLGFGTFSSFHTNPSYPEPCISHVHPGYKLVKACVKSIIVCRDKITGRFPWRSSATHRFRIHSHRSNHKFYSNKKPGNSDCWYRFSVCILYTSRYSSYWVSLST